MLVNFKASEKRRNTYLFLDRHILLRGWLGINYDPFWNIIPLDKKSIIIERSGPYII
jgi:hypothetical protein